MKMMVVVVECTTCCARVHEKSKKTTPVDNFTYMGDETLDDILMKLGSIGPFGDITGIMNPVTFAVYQFRGVCSADD